MKVTRRQLRRIIRESFDVINADTGEVSEFAPSAEAALNIFKRLDIAPEDMDFLNGEGWYECDNIEHCYGCDLESSYIDIEVPGQEDIIHYDNAYAIRDKYEDAEENAFEDIGKDYWLEDELVREEREVYTSEGNNYCYDPGHYFTAYSSEKGGFIDCEFELPDGHEFDERRLVFNTIDLDGNDFLNSISYIMPDDDPKDPTELDNMGGDTTGKGWECNMFEITRPMEGE